MSLDNGLERRSWGVYEMYTITHRREYTPECRHKIYSERPIALLTRPYPGRRRRRAAARPSRPPPRSRALSPLAGSSKLTRATRHPRGMGSGTLLHPPRGGLGGGGALRVGELDLARAACAVVGDSRKLDELRDNLLERRHLRLECRDAVGLGRRWCGSGADLSQLGRDVERGAVRRQHHDSTRLHDAQRVAASLCRASGADAQHRIRACDPVR
mmetsp:Transcript_212/g.549  ORF Transcript_212/g.549 Transcript_212/m.549 type:complete len:214 (-) Transcript_212:374-1015(-)